MDISSLRERGRAEVMSVAELNGYIKNIFDSNRTLMSVTVKGEISNFTNHRSGHLYFSLKDSESQIRAVMFRSAASRMKFVPESGMTVIVHGSVSVYPRDGSYQLYVNTMQPDGIGALYLAYEQLKEKLASEGLFDEERKLPIPKYPEKIGVITSPTGAAIRDIINVLGRRYPIAKVYLYPSLVQGEGAEENLIKGLRYFEESRLVDTVIIGRGGGSIEDLWAFNGERLARTVAELSIPVISAVGHETDFTICDFTSDLRAPTPSAAAELATPDIRELLLSLDACETRLSHSLTSLVDKKKERLDLVCQRFITEKDSFFSEKRDGLEEKEKELISVLQNFIKDKKSEFLLLSEKLNALSPLAVMSRGFSYASKGGRLVRRASELLPGDDLKINFSDGTADVKVIKTY